MLIAREEQLQKVREIKSNGFQWTRRIIALSSVLAIIVVPKMSILFGLTDTTVTFGWTEMQGWIFWKDESWTWKTVDGFVITPLDTHVVSAIIGLYFGGSLVDHGRR